MRKLTAVIATLVTALAVLVVGAAAPAGADVTSPANGATLRGTATLAASGGYDESPLGVCSGSGDTRIQLRNSSGGVVDEWFWDGEGARSVTIDTRNYPNGSYSVRAIERIRWLDWFSCKTKTRDTSRSVTIDNITALAFTDAPGTAPQNTSVSVSARLTDGHDGTLLANRPVVFSVSGVAGSVTANTNASGVATANVPLGGPPRTATITAAFAQTTHYKGSSKTSSIAITKNDTTTTLAQPASVVFGQPASLSATVARSNGTGTPTGTVQFSVNGANLGSPVPLSSGGATLNNVQLPVGTHTIGASYAGDGNFFASTAGTKALTVDKASTTTVLTSSGSPTVSGEPVTFTASLGVVAPGAGNPTGDVQFNVNGNPVGTAVPLTGNTAALTISNLDPGNHLVTATYNGDASFASSTSAGVTHGVDRADTTLGLTSSNPAAVSGEPLTFTADLDVVAPGAGNPTGGIQFYVDGNAVGSPVPVVGGSATSPTVNLDAGSHVVSADYAGDTRYAGSSANLTQVVAAAQTTTTVSSSPNPSVVGQPVTIRAEVAVNAPATGTPSGAVRFRIDGATVDVVDLVDGAAEIQVSDLSRGGHTIQAVYLTDSLNYNTSTSAEVGHTVNKAATKTVVTTSGSPSVYGQPVTFTAAVSVVAPGAGNPSGTITFTDGATVIGTQPVSSATGGQASITVSNLSVAQHAITATYSGDDSFLESNGTVTQRVNRAQTSMVLTSSANPSQSGQGVTFTAAISPVAPGAGDPTGTVQFTVNGLPLGGARTVTGGVATSPEFASLTPGTYKIAATYSGDGNFVGTSGVLDQGAGQNVTKGETSVGLTSDPSPSSYNQAVTFTATVDALAPATRRPTGVVQFWEGGVLLGATSLEPAGANQGTATFVTSSLTTGTHEVRAVYVGNFNYNGGSATTAHTVGGVPTVTGVSSSANPITFGDSVTFTAVVSEALAAPGSPTGSVTFTEGTSVLGTAPITTEDGQQVARITVPGLAAGTHPVKATYSGDATFTTSTSPELAQVVQRAAPVLAAKVIIRQIGDNGGKVRATLHGVNGAPLAGETIVFDTTQQTDHGVIHICTVTTDANGYAECDATTEILATILDVGYDAHFAGNANYLPADDHQTYFTSGDD